MKILVMGLPGSGKTWLAQRLVKHIKECAYFNADVIRGAANDWDFSAAGRLRQSLRMKNLADFENDHNRSAICDFVAPTSLTRSLFDADVVIWLDTIKESRFEDTNKIFEEPTNADIHVKTFLTDEQIEQLAQKIGGNCGNND